MFRCYICNTFKHTVLVLCIDVCVCVCVSLYERYLLDLNFIISTSDCCVHARCYLSVRFASLSEYRHESINIKMCVCVCVSFIWEYLCVLIHMCIFADCILNSFWFRFPFIRSFVWCCCCTFVFQILNGLNAICMHWMLHVTVCLCAVVNMFRTLCPVNSWLIDLAKYQISDTFAITGADSCTKIFQKML